MKNFRTLQVWQKAHPLALASYRFTSNFPRPELFGLTSQIRRSAASVPANIAEGCGKRGNGEFQSFLNIAPDQPANSNITFCWLMTSRI